MAAIILPDRWGRFPEGPIELNEQHWLVNRGGILLYAPLDGREANILGRWKTFTTDPVDRSGDAKLKAHVGNFNAQYIEHPAAVKTAAPLTLLCWAYHDTGRAEEFPLSLSRSGSGDRFAMSLTSAGLITASARTATVATSTTTSAFLNNTWFFPAARFDSSTYRIAGINGVYENANTTSKVPASLDRTLIGSRILTGEYSTYTGKIANALILGYGLLESDYRALYYEQQEAPYAMLRPRKRILYFSVSSGGRTGTLAATESGSDTASISGDVLVKGALAATESGSDSAAIAGKVLVGGALSVSESGADTAALAGDVLVRGALAASETGNDSASFIGEGFVPTATGTLAASESGSDTASIAGKVYIAGTLSAVEGGLDGFAASGNILVQGTLAASETGDDTAAFVQETLTLTPADLNAIAAAVWADPAAVAAHAKLDEIIARITC